MRTHSAFRTVLLCLLALVLVYGPVKAQGPNNGKPNQFTNGQNGTPNLPIAPSMIVDKNNMREVFEQDIGFRASELENRTKFLQSLYPAAQKAADDLAQQPISEGTIRKDYQSLEVIINTEYDRNNHNSGRLYLLEHSLSMGVEVRAGADKPIYSPEVTYGDTRSGLELGVAEYFQSAYTEGASHRDSLGVSLKYIPNGLAAHSLKRRNAVQKSLIAVEATNLNVQDLHDIINPDVSRIEEIEKRIKSIASALKIEPTTANDAASTSRVTILSVIMALEKSFSELDAPNNGVLEDFVARTRKPAVAFVIGDQSFHGGDIFNGGVTASYLHRFGEGAPGVTAVAVLQYLQDSFRDSGHRSAGRLGLAAIYQDTTLDLTHPTPPSKIEQLGPPWQYKIGIEYTSPVLGLHETGAVFARYRWTPSYIEVTTTYGKDGLRKDYLNVSVGKSFTF